MKGAKRRATAGCFKKGDDQRRHTAGQLSKDAVALGALLRGYLVAEAGKPCGKDKRTKAEALAVRVWDEAIAGKFPFVQFLADRIMGRVQDEMPKYDSRSLRFEYGIVEGDGSKVMEIRTVNTEAEDAARAEAAEARQQLQKYQDKFGVLA